LLARSWGAPGPLVVTTGGEERFDLADALGLLTFQKR
jgi:hypothetical protein